MIVNKHHLVIISTLREKIGNIIMYFSMPAQGHKLLNSILILSAATSVFLFVRLIFKDPASGAPDIMIGASALLSVWIIGVSTRRIRHDHGEHSRRQVLTSLIKITLVIAAVFFAHPILSQWTRLFIPADITNRLLAPLWFFVIPVVGISMLVWRTDSWNGYWKAFLTGVCGGSLLLYLWTPLVYLATFNLFVPGIKFYADGFYELSQWALGIGVGILFLSGIVALQAGKPTSRQQAISFTAITSFTIALFLFATPGSILSGIASQSSLYGVAFSRIGYDEAGWIDAVVKAIIHIFPWLHAVLLACLSIGALPILIGLIWPVRRTFSTSAPTKHVSAFIPVLLFFLFFTIMLMLEIFVLLAEKIINTFEAAGSTSWWDPEWIVPTLVAFPSVGIALLLTQVLIQLPSRTHTFQNAVMLRTIGCAIFLGALGINFVYPYAPWSVLFLIGVGTELIIQANRLTPTTTLSNGYSDLTEQSEQPTSIVSMSAPFALLLSLPLLVIPVVLSQIPIVTITELRKVTAPPPGQEWLLELIQNFAFTMPAISWAFIAGLFTSLFSLVYALRPTNAQTIWKFSERRIRRIVDALIIKSLGGMKEYVFVTVITLSLIYFIVFGSPTFSTALLAFLLLCILVNAGQPAFRNYSMLTYVVAAIIIVLEVIFLAYQRELPVTAFDSTIVLWPAFAVLYAGLVSSDGSLRKSLGRILFLTAIGALATLIMNFANPVTLVENGIAKLSGGQWQVLDFREGYLVSDRNYSLSEDPEGRVWFVGYFGPDAVEQNDNWLRLRFYPNVSDFIADSEGRVSRLEAPGLFLAQGGNYWFTSESNIYMLVPTTNGYVSYTPHQAVGVSKDPKQTSIVCGPSSACPDPDLGGKNISSAMVDNAGNIWVGSYGAGLVRFLPDRSPDNAVWDYITTENSSLASNNISDILQDDQENLWFLGPNAISVLSPNETWTNYFQDDLGLEGDLQAIYQDKEQRTWIGSANGISRWESGTWIASPEFQGSVNRFYEDSNGQLWALTTSGVYQLRNGKWLFFRDIPQDPLWQHPFRISSFYHLEPYGTGVTVMTEDLDGVLWFGGPRGLLKYDPRAKQVEDFYPSNSGLPAENVRSLMVDSNNVLWVSTYTVNRAFRSELPVVGFAFLLLTVVLGNLYSEYQRSAPFKARQISRRLSDQPQMLLKEIYATFKGSDPSAVLENLTQHLRTNRETHGLALAIATIGVTDVAPNEKANHIFQALNNMTTLPEGRELAGLYHYFTKALSVLSVKDIAQLSFFVLRSQDGQKITFTYERSVPYDLPSLVDAKSADPLEMIGKSSVLLRKYLQIDTSQDKLGFIADSLGAIERAKRDTESMTGPEHYFIREICNLWLSIISRELDVLSGRADLQVEFRTRQVKQSDEVTLVLGVRNAGNAIANQVQVSLLPNAGIHLETKTTHLFEYIGAGTSETVEFSITAPTAGDVRVAGEIIWSDRIEDNRRIEFADVIRFYESTGRFERIPNPYIVGHPVKSASLFQGREDIFDFISHNIHGTTQSRTLVLYGQRRTGKTSILYQLLNGRLGREYISILVDMQELAPGIHGMADLLLELALHMERSLRKAGLKLEKIDESAFVRSPTRSFSHFLSGFDDKLAGRKIVLLFDEFELLEERIHQGKLEPESLGYLRSLMQHRDNLVFIFTGTHKLEQMSQDYWSIFFSIALHQQVSFMKDDDATHLIRDPVQGKLSIDDLVVEKILSLAYGHPYFIQLLCWALVNYCNKKEKNYATLSDLNEVLKDIVSAGDAYFAYIWTPLSTSEKIVMSALAERLVPGKNTISIQEIMETIENVGVQNIDRATAIRLLDELTNQEILVRGGHSGLLYSYRVGLIGEWVKSSKPLQHLVEHKL